MKKNDTQSKEDNLTRGDVPGKDRNHSRFTNRDEYWQFCLELVSL